MTNQLLAELGMANKKIEEKDKEIERLNNLLNKSNNEVASYADECIRLNNIINKLENYLDVQFGIYKVIDKEQDSRLSCQYLKVLDKLKELKEGK